MATILALYINAQNNNPILEADDDAPKFILKRLDSNESIQIDELKGKGIMINFWATYCEPCKEEMPYMEKLYKGI